MAQPKTAPEVEWLPKKDAAIMLGVGTRQLETRAKNGQVRNRRLPRKPHQTAAPVEYNVEDIQAILSGQPNQHQVVVAPERAALETPVSETALPAAAESQALVPAARQDGWNSLAAHLAVLSAAYPAPQQVKPWLTLEEAAEYSGLPSSYLQARYEAGTIHAVNVGTGQRKYLRFNRESLANIV